MIKVWAGCELLRLLPPSSPAHLDYAMASQALPQPLQPPLPVAAVGRARWGEAVAVVEEEEEEGVWLRSC